MESDLDTPKEALPVKDSKPTGAKKAAAVSVSYWKLYSHAEPLDYLLIVLGTLGSLISGCTMPLFTIVFGDLVDTYGAPAADSKLEKSINRIALDFVYLAIATLVASFFEVAMFTWTGVRQAAKVRQVFLEAALCQDITFYDVQSTSGDVLMALNDDTQALQNAIGEKVGNTIHHVVTFVAGIIIAFINGWKLTLVMLSLTPLLGIAGTILSAVMTKGGNFISKAYSNAQTLCSQAITNVRTVVSFAQEDHMVVAYKDNLVEPSKMGVKLGVAQGAALGFLNGIVFCTYGLAFWYGAKLVREEGYSGGDVLIVIFSAIIGGFGLGQAGPNFQYFAKGCAAGARLFATIDRRPPIDLSAPGIVPDKPTQGNIDFKDVDFSYPARPELPVFRKFSLQIGAGQEVALVGQSGSGKSTVIQLIERFYDPAGGMVMLDGVDIRQLSLPWYRSQVGLVSQEPTLFATTIKANILLGSENSTDEEVIAAAKAANAHRFISLMPKGYDTQVGERGVQLSGGQKQRIAIARAILKNPRIMLLDEATSALDTRSERMVQAAIDKLAVGRTSVVVAHRLSTIRNADKIAVVQHGQVIEQGDHATLFGNPDSVYHSLVKLQEMASTINDTKEPTAADAEVEEEQEVEEVVKASQRDLENDSKRNDSKRRASVTNAPSKREPSKREAEPKEGDKVELTEEEKKVKVGMGRLLAFNRPEWGYIFTGCIMSGLLGCVMPGFALLLSELIGIFYPKPGKEDEAKRRALLYSLLFVALGVAQLIASLISSFCFSTTGVRLSERIRVMLMRSIMHQEVGWFDRDENTSGAITTRLSNDASSVRGAAGDVLGIFVQNIVTLIAGYIIAFTAGWKMTLVVTSVLPLIIFSSFVQMKFYVQGSGNASDEFQKANQTAAEGILALRTVASFGLEKNIAALYRSLLHEPIAKSQRFGVLQGFAFGCSQAIQFAFYALAFWYGGQLLLDGDMNLVQMMKVFMAILLSSMGAGQAQMAFPDVAKGKTAVARVFAIVDRKSLIDSSDESGQVLDAVKGEIALRDVCFAYPSRPDVPVFNNFNLTVRAGEITALVGESGSGKSTIINLIERFYDPTSGQVFLDGVDLRQLKINFLRSCVGLVSQEPMLFNGTILDNIKFGKRDATMDEIVAAAKVANALEFIERQPDKFGTLLGEGGGISLSGGQKQRIAIARAVLKDPRVLLLDEATSALDSESERLVQEALDRIMVGRTSVVIAHRLTTVRNAHKIAVVQRGVVLEEGNHDELMQKGSNGAYVQLAMAQVGAH